MAIDLESIPQRVRPYAAAAADYVWNSMKVELELSQAALPILDQYLRRARDADATILELVASTVGCFLGEILRRDFDGQWIHEGELPASWTIELAWGLAINPVAMAAEAAASGPVEGLDGSLYVPDEYLDPLTQILDQADPVDEETFYSLTNRYEVIQRITQTLAGMKAADQGQHPDETSRKHSTRRRR